MRVNKRRWFIVSDLRAAQLEAAGFTVKYHDGAYRVLATVLDLLK
jgi:hypothetical protein